MTLLEQQRMKWIGVAGALLLISGCSNFSASETSANQAEKTKDRILAEKTPKQWTGTAGNLLTQGEVVNGNWWTNLKDPQLNRIINQAVGSNYQVWQAKARVAQAQAQAVIAGADRLPSVSAGTSPSATRRGAGAAGFSTTESYGLDLNISWEVDLWNRLQAQSAAARENYLASHEALRAVRQSVAAQTAKAYFTVVEARQQVNLSQKTLAVFKETARQVGNRADVGIAAPTDKFLSISNRESAAAGLAGNQEVLARSSRQLQRLTTDYPDGKVQTAGSLVNLPALPPAGVPAGLLARRPDVLAAEKRLRAAGFSVVSAQKTLLPAISLSTRLGTASNELNNILDGDFSYWSLAGNLLQPIFQGGKLRANVRLNEARQQEAANAYAQTVLTAFAEVESALAARAIINRRQAALCSAANASKSAERVSFNRYRQGVEPYLTVLESQQRTLNAASACIAARRAALENYIDLQLALGGGFDERKN